jgi:hypothetical protein
MLILFLVKIVFLEMNINLFIGSVNVVLNGQFIEECSWLEFLKKKSILLGKVVIKLN